MSYQLPFAVLPMLHLTGSARLMGVFVNTRWVKAVGWSSGVLLIPLNISIVFHLLGQNDASVALVVVFAIICTVYFVFLLVLIRDDISEFIRWVRPAEHGPDITASPGDCASPQHGELSILEIGTARGGQMEFGHSS